jgi:hypothetical protein
MPMKDILVRGACLAVLVGCGSQSTDLESIATTVQALSTTATRVLGFESLGDWTTTSGQLAPHSRRVEGAAALAIANPGYAVITSRTLGTLGDGVASLIGFDIQIPDLQPNPYWFGTVQLFLNLPSRGINNFMLGQQDLTYQPRGIFRRVEFPLSTAVQSALNGTYGDLQFSLVLNVPAGAGPYALDRLSFVHAESELVDNSRNAAILGFETLSSWSASSGTTSLVERRTERDKALSVSAQGYTVVTSDRLATPATASAVVGFDIRPPRQQSNPDWHGDASLFVELPSQGVFNAYVGRADLAGLPGDTFSRLSFELPPDLPPLLGRQFDDLRFKIALNVPEGAGHYALDRFRLGEATAPTEKVDVTMPLPSNVAATRLLFVAKQELTIGAGTRIPALDGTRMVLASLGTFSIGAGAEVDSLLGMGRVDLGPGARVTGFVAGTTDVVLGAGAQVLGSSGGAAGPVTAASWTTSFEPSTADVVVGEGTRVTLPAGRHRNVTVTSGVLALRPGEHRIDRLRVESGGRIEIDTNAGSITTFVRDELTVVGSAKDAGLQSAAQAPGGARPLHQATWLYSGTADVVIPVDWPARLIAPDAKVTATWDSALVPGALPPVIGGIWGEIVRIPVPPVSIRDRPVVVLTPPVLDPFDRSTPIIEGSPTDVRVGEQDDAADGSLPQRPVLVQSDNPTLFGSIAWHGPNESGSGTPPYFFDGAWNGIANAHLALRHSPNTNAGWSARLLPGARDQTPSSASNARFQTRTFNLYHGKTFRITRTLTHTSDNAVVGTAQDSTPLYVALDPQILLVPLMVIGWDSPAQPAALTAAIDYIPSSSFPADQIGTGNEPTPSGTLTDPGRAQLISGSLVPPDEIWSQCGIQFQVVSAFHLTPKAPFDFNRVCNTFGSMQDYALSYSDLEARIRAKATGNEFELLFGTGITGEGGLRPIIVQYGAVPGGGCSAYKAKADIALGHIQINEDNGQVIGHELGHSLLRDPDHSLEDNNLMRAGATGRLLSATQCAAARQNAAAYSARLRAFYVARGLADQVPPPPLVPYPRGPALTPGRLYDTTCCALPDGVRKVRTLASLCFFLGGRPSTDCNLCCRSRRSCPADSCCERSADQYEIEDLSDCEPEDQAPLDACTCCRFASQPCSEVLMPSEACLDQGGSICFTDPK